VTAPEPVACALLLVAAMAAAGVAHVLWLRRTRSRGRGVPIDGRATFRRRRLFGDNKTWRGTVVLPPAAAATFGLCGLLRPHLPSWLQSGMWPLSPAAYAVLGFACGAAFLAAELPNSFLKRQLDVLPGEAPRNGALAALCFVIDRVDSAVGVLILITLLLPVRPATWLWVLLLGPGVHLLFSLWLHRMGVKSRWA
jgi:CDP-2,3-bis-(O-geranylgeranyl)-sn-glycerol synthase